MKMITPEKLEHSLLHGTDIEDEPRDNSDKAPLSVERMIAIGTPSRFGV
jgi:quinolinate synthase